MPQEKNGSHGRPLAWDNQTTESYGRLDEPKIPGGEGWMVHEWRALTLLVEWKVLALTLN